MQWKDVLWDWQKAEEEAWRPVYAERGFGSWLEWRESYIRDLRLDERTWDEATIPNPHDVVPTYAIGGFRGWKKYRPADKDVATFEDIGMVPVLDEIAYDGSPREDIGTNPKVNALVGKLRDTTILTLRCDEFIVVLDGTHRCATIALETTVLSQFRLTVREAAFATDELPMLLAFCRDRAAVVKT